MAALRSLVIDRHADLPLRRRRFTLSLVLVVIGELIGFAVVASVIARLV